MKPVKYLLTALFILMGISESNAQPRNLGIGLIIGEPTGLSLKLWRSPTKAIAMGLGWSVFDNQNDPQTTRIHLHMDFLRHSYNRISSQERLPVYYGIGGRFIGGSETQSSLALRGVLGIAWEPASTPLDLFLEIAPSLQVVPSSHFNLDAALGIRYFI